MVSSIPTPPSTTNLESLTHGPGRTLQGTSTLSDSPNLVPQLPENGAWSIQNNHHNIHNFPSAPPPTDISSIPDSNGSLWSFLPTESGWELNFDALLAAEPSSSSLGATSSMMSGLDLFQKSNPQTQGSDSAGLSGELVEYLNPGGKVSIYAIAPA